MEARGALLSHLSFGVRDLERSIRFYDATLAPLGAVRVWTQARAAGYGPPDGEDRLALFLRAAHDPPGPGFHLAFDAPSEAAVDRFFRAAMEHGGQDLGRPGKRPNYGPTYYAAYVADPDGHKLEAVFQAPLV